MSTHEQRSPSPLKVIEADLMAAGFTPFRDSTELMDELAARGPDGRSGIYVHFFAGEEEWFYLGLSVDVRKRYQQHIKNHTDIIKSAWLSVPKDDLVAMELKYLSLMQGHNANLRNILKHREQYRWEDCREIFEGGHGDRWLEQTGPDQNPYAKVDKELEVNYAKRYAEFKAHAEFDEQLLDLLNYYLRNFVPMPTKTDQMFWNVTCLNPGGYNKPFDQLIAFLRVNIHMPEVFTLILNETYEGTPKLTFNFHAADDQLSDEDIERYNADKQLALNKGNYASTGGKQVQFSLHDIGTAWKLMRDPVFQRAVKVSNLRLMRMGLLARRLSQSHCLPLAKEALGRTLT
jgi:hypothetical protein